VPGKQMVRSKAEENYPGVPVTTFRYTQSTTLASAAFVIDSSRMTGFSF